jgi:hypothetical protein
MSSADDPDGVLHRALDPDTVDRLLHGALDPNDAPAGLSDAASLIRAARQPASESELVDRVGAVDALVGEGLRRSAANDPDGGVGDDGSEDPDTIDLRRLTRLPRGVRSVLIGLAVVGALAGAAGAATGVLPVPGLDRSDPAPTTEVPRPSTTTGADDGPTDHGGTDRSRQRPTRPGERRPDVTTTTGGSTTTAVPVPAAGTPSPDSGTPSPNAGGPGTPSPNANPNAGGPNPNSGGPGTPSPNAGRGNRS